jgi:hypothetical protein
MHQEEPTSNRQVAALNAVALAGARTCTSVSGAKGSTSRPAFDGVADVFNMLIGCVEWLSCNTRALLFDAVAHVFNMPMGCVE